MKNLHLSVFLVVAMFGAAIIFVSLSESSISGAVVAKHPAKKPSPSFEYRTIDGTGNNLANPYYGSVGISLLRVSGSDYADDVSAPSGPTRENARVISNIVVAQDGSMLNSASASDFLWQWGQLLDHDLDLTTTANPPEPFNIPVPAGDLFFDPLSVGGKFILLNRASHNNGAPREQLNVLTAFIDASNVYGSDAVRAAALRTFTGGKLKTSSGNLLPFNTGGLPNAGGPSPYLYLAGDVRVNEQIALTAIHALFVREHNRLADQIKLVHPELSDEEVYQRVRKIVGAEMQVITYDEWLPFLLGKNALPKYKGYNSQVNPGIANEFSTASFRFGHTLLSPGLLRIMDSGASVIVPLRASFLNPGLVPIDGGIESILRGLAGQKAQEIDAKIVDDVRNFLFGLPGSGGFDLASLNIQRGRDHGLPDYNIVRQAYGLSAVTSFSDISSDPEVQEALADAYDSVDDIDLWVGGLAEDPVDGALVGETIRAVLVDQFVRVRDGDRFWYEIDPFFKYYPDLMNYVKKTRLSDVINLNIDGKEVQKNAFVVD